MILYLDTSALLKRYLREPASPEVAGAMVRATAVCIHLIAYTEVRAGLARAARMGRISVSDLDKQVRRFEVDWTKLDVVGVDEPLVRRSGHLAQEHGLRGFDSLHLAAVERVYAQIAGTGFVFFCYDAALCDAAARLGIPTSGAA